eukprot:COSAG02_NODE_506_length_20931_cov_20.533218_3_plen_171_part_00
MLMAGGVKLNRLKGELVDLLRPSRIHAINRASLATGGVRDGRQVALLRLLVGLRGSCLVDTPKSVRVTAGVGSLQRVEIGPASAMAPRSSRSSPRTLQPIIAARGGRQLDGASGDAGAQRVAVMRPHTAQDMGATLGTRRRLPTHYGECCSPRLPVFVDARICWLTGIWA